MLGCVDFATVGTSQLQWNNFSCSFTCVNCLTDVKLLPKVCCDEAEVLAFCFSGCHSIGNATATAKHHFGQVFLVIRNGKHAALQSHLLKSKISNRPEEQRQNERNRPTVGTRKTRLFLIRTGPWSLTQSILRLELREMILLDSCRIELHPRCNLPDD